MESEIQDKFKVPKTFTLKPVQVATQVVAGKNYFFKVFTKSNLKPSNFVFRLKSYLGSITRCQICNSSCLSCSMAKRHLWQSRTGRYSWQITRSTDWSCRSFLNYFSFHYLTLFIHPNLLLIIIHYSYIQLRFCK